MSQAHYRHMDGGLYRFVAHAMSADTDREVVVYEHLWPFEPGLWVRDRQEFEARFSPVSSEVVEAAQRGDREAAQAMVNAAKAARRALKAG